MYFNSFFHTKRPGRPKCYPKIDYAILKGTLWTIQQLNLKNASALWNFYCFPFNVLKRHFRDMATI